MAGETVPDKAAAGQAAAGQAAQAAADENFRQAAIVKVGISNYVGTATLAVLAGGVALFTYFQQNFNVSDFFYGSAVAAAVLLVASLFLGGKGASSMADKLARGTWRGEKTRAFNWQAILALAGTVALVIATVAGTSSHRTTTTTKDPCVALLSRELAMPHPHLKQLRNELTLCEAVRS
jgi:hypothetical protein